MLRGEHAEVVRPGDKTKRHLAGSLGWRTGTLLVSPFPPSESVERYCAGGSPRASEALFRLHSKWNKKGEAWPIEPRGAQMGVTREPESDRPSELDLIVEDVVSEAHLKASALLPEERQYLKEHT